MAISAPSYQRLEAEVLHLPRVDRSQLAARLLESLDQDEHQPSSEWIEELRRRVGNIDAGKAKLIPAADLWNEANQRFGPLFRICYANGVATFAGLKFSPDETTLWFGSSGPVFPG